MGRYSLVLILLVLTGWARVAVQPPAQPPLVLPEVGRLLAGGGWQVEATQSSHWGMPYRQWTLRHTSGQTVFLFLAATTSPKTVVHWSGELGYEGEGYVVQRRSSYTLHLSSGASARVSVVRIERLNEQRVLTYAIVSRDGIVAHGTDNLLRTGWKALWGAAGPYYLVRVAAPGGDQAAAGEAVALQLLAQALPVLQTQLESAASKR